MEQGHDSDEDDGSNALDEDRLILGNLWVSIVDGKVDSILFAQLDEVFYSACDLNFAIRALCKLEVDEFAQVVVDCGLYDLMILDEVKELGIADLSSLKLVESSSHNLIGSTGIG